MRKKLPIFLLACALVLPSPPPLTSQTPDSDLAAGIRQVEEGDFEAGIMTLDPVVQRLSLQGGRSRELSRAYLYLAIAYLNLDQRDAAKAKMLEAWRNNQELRLSPAQFPPRVIRLFEEATGLPAAETAPAPAPRPDTAAAPAPSQPKKKGGSKTILLVLGAGAAAAGVAVAVGGGGGGTSSGGATPTTRALQPVFRTLSFSATDLPLTIRDFSTVVSRISAGGLPGTLTNVVVNVSITHTFISDLRVVLQHPNGTQVTLHNRTGGSADNIVTSYTPANVPALASLNGSTATGTWTLTVSDQVFLDVGRLNAWSLGLTAQTLE